MDLAAIGAIMRAMVRNTPRLVLLFIALGACGRATSMTLEAPDTLSQATAVGAAPMVALAPGGQRTMAWVSAPGGGTDGRLYVTTDGAPVTELRDSLGPIEPHGEAPPKLTYGADGTLYALYAVGKVLPGRRFPFTTLRLAASTDRGATWSAPATVTGDALAGSRNFHALHAGGDGTLYVAWLEARGDAPSGAYLTRSMDGGRSWLPAVRVAPGEACPCCRTAIATATGGTLYLAWRSVFPGNIRDVVVASSPDRGATWTDPVRVHADDWVFEGCPHAGPSMLVDERGTVHLAWWTGKERAAGVYYARSTDGARSFQAPVPLGVAGFSTPAHPQLALAAGGTVLAAWDDGRGALPTVLLRVSRNGGVSFGGQVVASDSGAAAGFPVVALRGNQFTVAWAQRTREAHVHAEQRTMNMSDPAAAMPLPEVGGQRIVLRRGRLEP
jgi:hypothetical protein